MMNEESKVKDIFKQYMAEELGNSEINRAKKKLIREHFSQPPAFVFRPVILIPLLSFAAAFILILQMYKPVPKPAVEPLRTVSVEKPVLETIPIIPQGLDVKVREASSEVGATMVYQKAYQDAPVTIIWVFTGRTNQ